MTTPRPQRSRRSFLSLALLFAVGLSGCTQLSGPEKQLSVAVSDAKTAVHTSQLSLTWKILKSWAPEWCFQALSGQSYGSARVAPRAEVRGPKCVGGVTYEPPLAGSFP